MSSPTATVPPAPRGDPAPPVPTVSRTVLSVSSLRIVGVICYGASTVFTARLVGPRVLGPLVAWISALAVAQVVLDAGMTTYSIRELSRHPGWRAFRWFLRIRAGVSGLLLVPAPVALASDRVVGLAGGTAGALLVYLSLHCTGDILTAPALAAGRQAAVAVWQAAERVVCLPVVLLLGSAGFRESALPLAMVSGALVFTVAAARSMRRRPQTTPGPPVAKREVARRCASFATTSFGSQLQNLDVALVSVVAGPVQAGFYGIPSRLTNPLVLVVSSFCSVLFPRLSRDPTARALRSTLSVIRRGAVVAGVFAGVGALLVGPALRCAVGSGYSGAAGATRVILVAVAVLAVTMPLATVLQAFDRERRVARAIAVTSLVGLPVTALGAAAGGATGAASGWLAGQLLVLVLLAVEIHRLRRSLDG